MLRVLTLTLAQNQVTVGWKSVSNKNYRIEAASDVNGSWVEVGSQVTGSGNTSQTALSRISSDQRFFYRVRVVP